VLSRKFKPTHQEKWGEGKRGKEGGKGKKREKGKREEKGKGIFLAVPP
jgi:hypothetical protein